jgi:hypothetical protein
MFFAGLPHDRILAHAGYPWTEFRSRTGCFTLIEPVATGHQTR